MRIGDETRMRIIEAYINGQSKKTISEMFGINISTIYSIIKTYINDDRIKIKIEGRGREKILDDMHIAYIRELIDIDAGITLNKIKQKLIEKYNITISKSTIDRYIIGFNYSFKRISLVPMRRNNQEAINAREAYARTYLDYLSQFSEDQFVFIDEVGFNITMRTRGGRSLVGTRAVQVVSALRTRNISVCCAITKCGILKYSKQTSAFNMLTFLNFINELIEKLEIDGITRAVLVMDNVPFHRCEEIARIIRQRGHEILYLPPYSPFLNPIENMFSQWKQYIRCMRPENETDLFNLIDNVENIISSDNCSSYYRHMFSFINRCLSRQEIIDE